MVTNMVKDLEHLSHEKRWREVGLFSLEKREKGVINANKYLKGEC